MFGEVIPARELLISDCIEVYVSEVGSGWKNDATILFMASNMYPRRITAGLMP